MSKHEVLKDKKNYIERWSNQNPIVKLIYLFFITKQVLNHFQACCGMVDTSHAMQMGQVMAAWDRVGLKAEEAAKNKNSTSAMPS